MQIAPVPANEATRIARLRLLNILDSQSEERFDRLTRITKRLFSVPIAQVTLIDTDRQWFKASAGAPRGETSRDISFCSHAILNDEIMHVPDARADERFVDNPLVMGGPNIHFYAGCPLRVGDHNLGTLCVIDDKPHEFGDEEHKLLRDLAEMAEQELAALQTATTDHLTGLSNRRGFEILARHTLNVCKRLQRPATLLYFDLNRFKWINDVLGHAEGDLALKRFAQALLAVFRDSDVIGRLGGDEFAVLLAGTPMESSHIAVARLTAWLQDADRAEPRGYAIECSSGEAEFDAGQHESIEDLLADADRAMYVHKAASRPGYEELTPSRSGL
jgi:diguanylate cyclase (GGDEF)-like protein